MNKSFRVLIICTLVGLFTAMSAGVYAGNKDRSGQAGAQHLLIDPWARSNGWGTAGVAEIRGLEAIHSNVAGMAFTNRTQVGFSRVQYLAGSGAGIAINTFGLSQALFSKDKETGRRLKDFGVLGVSAFIMKFGDIPITTTDQPEGNMGTFSPSMNYIGIHYAKSFNNFIHGGVSIKVVTETGSSDCRATGIAIDAGVQYLSGAYENFKIGLTMKNIGLPMSYKGDGLSVRGVVNNTSHELTLEQRSAEYELPSLLTIGLSYDFLIWTGEYKNMSKDDRIDEGLTRDDAEHRITLAGSFTANSFSRDIFAFGIEYGFRKFFMIRAGYAIEGGMWKESTCTTWYTGPSAGVTFAIPIKNTRLLLDYAYRFTNKWKGNHYIGLKFEM